MQIVKETVCIKCQNHFSSPGRSPGRAIAQPPALASASESASTITLKLFKSLYFPDHLIDMVHICNDIVPKFYSAIPLPQGQDQVTVMDLENV